MAHVLFIGRTTLDAIYILDRLPEEDTKVFAKEFLLAPGGPATNAALTSARLGSHAHLISAVGDGLWADRIRSVLAAERVELLDLAAGTGYETPLTTVWATAPKRTVVNPPIDRRPVKVLNGGWSQSVPAAWGPVPPVALCDGFYLAETFPLLTACHAAGTKLVMDGGSWKPGTAELAPLLTAAVVSERFRVPGVQPSPESIFAYFSQAGVPLIAITRGQRSILASDRGRRFEVSIEPVEGAETLGAGDVLHGALAHYLSEGLAFEPALTAAAHIASASCHRLGTDFRSAL
jgi:sugar/nucleoside kinase (ribokinase family)